MLIFLLLKKQLRNILTLKSIISIRAAVKILTNKLLELSSYRLLFNLLDVNKVSSFTDVVVIALFTV